MGGSKSKEPEKPVANLQDASQSLETKIDDLAEKIKKADEEARGFVAKQATDPTAKARAMQALKRKKMYEQQRDQLVNTQFNVENLAFQQEQAQITATTVEAMKAATEKLKQQTAKIGVDQVDKLKDDMEEMAAEMKEIQDALAHQTGGQTEVEDEAAAELEQLYAQQAHEEEVKVAAILAGGGASSSGYAAATVPAATAPAAAAKSAAAPSGA
eukprot:TRINITY_DN75922_c0_g1_i1.p1 TRINITY_DN75922_c0_g1~~TRINITY_DN75922_c0_g1_i1.p1  ORF type:complete len:214 (-),score=85.25 TRINITY_DN75922_c0_g1_i1:197-838(-)